MKGKMILGGQIGAAKGLPKDAQRDSSILFLNERLSLFPQALLNKYQGIENEKGITSELVDFLENFGNRNFIFKHEDPENPLNGNSHVCDFAIKLRRKEEDLPLTIYKVEAKRLSRREFYNSEEYLMGKTSPTKQNGGVERFKILEHGRDLDRCGMLAYVQSDTFEYWVAKINQWITGLSKQQGIHPQWYIGEQLATGNVQPKMARFSSTHLRTNSTTILLDHFWLDLT
jgi:hypothetical protein